MIRALLRVPLVGVLLYVVYLNVQLYYRPKMQPVAGQQVNQDLVQQLRYLKTRLHAGAAQEMQEVYPEGFVYLNALYALSWTELAAGVPAQVPLYQEALQEARWSIHAIDSNEGRAPFDADLPLPYGAYYQGWRAYTLGRYLAAQAPARRDTAEVRRFASLCAQLAQALNTSSTPYPESYMGRHGRLMG